MLNPPGEIESDKLVESAKEKEEKSDGERASEGEEGEAVRKAHVVKRRTKKGRSNRHQVGSCSSSKDPRLKIAFCEGLKLILEKFVFRPLGTKFPTSKRIWSRKFSELP